MKKLFRTLYKVLYQQLSGSGIHRFAVIRKIDALVGATLRKREAEVEGHRLTLDPGDSLKISIVGEYEPEVTRLVKQEIHPGDVIVDVGAHIGYFTLLFAKLVGERGKVYAFEPDPNNFALLKANVEANGYTNIVLEQKAVSASTGTLTLYRSDDNPADHRIYDPQGERSPIEISTVSLDDYLAERSSKVDFVKVDVQGAEISVINGMKHILKQNATLKLITEFWPSGLQAAGFSQAEYLDLLKQQGFDFYQVENGTELLQPCTIQQLNDIYTSEKQNFTNLFCSRAVSERP